MVSDKIQVKSQKRCNHTHLGHERAYQVLADFNHIRSLQPVAQFVPQFRQVNDSFELFSVHDICTVDQSKWKQRLNRIFCCNQSVIDNIKLSRSDETNRP